MNDITRITPEEIAELLGSEINPGLVLEILAKPAVIIDDCEVDAEQFSQWWSYALEGMIDSLEQSPEWWTAYRANEAWGRELGQKLDAWCWVQDDEDDEE